MNSARDEERRASAYIASTKPLFQARNMERKFFTRSRVSRDEPVVSPEDSPPSRIPLPKNTSSPRVTTSLRDAYERAMREEHGSPASVNGPERYKEVEGSPSPAPRPRPIGQSQREKDEHRMMRLREGMRVVTSSPIGQDVENYQVSPLEDDGTIRSNGSGGSGLSPEEEFTDQWLRETKRATSDQKRMTSALDSQKPLFTRGGMGTRVTETAQTLVRKSSVSSLESEPGVRIPRTWGRLARKNPGWLNRVSSPEMAEDVYGLPQQAISEGTIDWAGAAEDALASVENGSPAYEPTPPHSRPNSAQHQNFSNQKSHIWDPEFDFTAQSVQESTSPQLKVRNTKLDEIRAREIEFLSKRAVATARLEEIQQRNFTAQSGSTSITTSIARIAEEKRQSEAAEQWVQQRFRSASDTEESSRLEALAEIAANTPLPEESSIKDSETKVQHEAQTPGERRIQDTETKVPDEPKPLTTTSKEILPVVSESNEKEPDIKAPFVTESLLQDHAHDKTTILEEEGEHIPGTPVTIFRGKGVKEKKPSQLGHNGDDSWENLRRLSRVLSATPSPAASKLAERPSDESLKNLNRLSADIKRLSGASTPPKSDIDPEERIVSEVSLFALQDDKPERNSLRTPSPAGDDGVDETPRHKPDSLTVPTPVVTGAYIDTPATRGRQPKISRPSSPPLATGDTLHDEVSRLCRKDFMRGSSSQSSTSRKDARTVQRGTEHGASHLSSSSAAQSPRRKPSQRSRPPLVNSAHLTSAEDDLRAIQQAAEDSTLDDFDGLILASEDDSDPNSTTIMEPLTDLEKDEKGQPLSAEERERRREILAIARMNKTIKSGLVSIRDAKRGIERLEDQVSSTPEPFEHNHDQHSCPKCALDNSNSSFVYMRVPTPRLWTRDDTKLAGVQFTWLGLFLVLFATWFFLESATCEAICHPQYAATNDWHIDDPFWGWAIPTLLDRSTGGVIGYGLKNIPQLALWIFSLWNDRSGGVSGVNDGAWGWDQDEIL
jgi:hypothetical protein